MLCEESECLDMHYFGKKKNTHDLKINIRPFFLNLLKYKHVFNKMNSFLQLVY